jgi:SRSO17 transposase
MCRRLLYCPRYGRPRKLFHSRTRFPIFRVNAPTAAASANAAAQEPASLAPYRRFRSSPSSTVSATCAPRPAAWESRSWCRARFDAPLSSEDEKAPTKYWFSTLPANIAFRQLVDTAKLRWRIERDYHEGEAGAAAPFVDGGADWTT